MIRNNSNLLFITNTKWQDETRFIDFELHLSHIPRINPYLVMLYFHLRNIRLALKLSN